MPFRIIHTADIHGNKSFYERLFEKSKDNNINAVVIGGDLSPKDFGPLQCKIENQERFFLDFFIPLVKNFRKQNPKKNVFLIMGNDDFKSGESLLMNPDKNGVLHYIHKKQARLNDSYKIAGYSFVNPTPFRMKDWEKDDFRGDKMPPQVFGEEFRSADKEKGTIDEDLQALKRMTMPRKTVYVMHAPPYNTKLDIITSNAHVGSRAIREFIEKEQPPLTLHGHIHESPKMSGSWKDKIKNTICINVGSSYPDDKLNCAIINLEDLGDIEYLEI